jgi:hypothetical protein
MGVATTCACVTATHERSGCPGGVVLARRAALYGGLFDGAWQRMPAPPGRVRLLNPDYDEDDPVARRFAQLEVD